MSSWVQAAWIVKKISETIQLPNKIIEYRNQLDAIQNQLTTLDNNLESIPDLIDLQSDINKIQDSKLAFIAMNNNNQPSNIPFTVAKDSIWFVSDN